MGYFMAECLGRHNRRQARVNPDRPRASGVPPVGSASAALARYAVDGQTLGRRNGGETLPKALVLTGQQRDGWLRELVAVRLRNVEHGDSAKAKLSDLLLVRLARLLVRHGERLPVRHRREDADASLALKDVPAERKPGAESRNVRCLRALHPDQHRVRDAVPVAVSYTHLRAHETRH